jgi:hypothetical protein
MSAKLLRSGVEPFVAANHVAIGGSAAANRKPFNSGANVPGWKLQTAGRMASVQWKRPRLPCRRMDWWRCTS